MNKKTIESMNQHAIEAYPKEACGLIIVAKGKERYIPCRNMAVHQREHFILSPEDYADAEDKGEIIGVFHSHPDYASKASEADKVGCEHSGLPWYITAVFKDTDGVIKVLDSSAISPTGFKLPLIGREFQHGLIDCYTLVQDWYIENRGVNFGDYTRSDEWWDKGENLYLDNMEKCGLRQIDLSSELEVGDIILMQIRGKKPNHAGVYVGDGLFIHHFYGRLSSKDIYGGYWREVTVSYWRMDSVINK